MIKYGKTVICDTCGAEEFMVYPEGVTCLEESQELPIGWSRVTIDLSHAPSIRRELCTDCTNNLFDNLFDDEVECDEKQ